ncbi:Orc1/CDC6 [Hexamita inflata]|uniref:Orc1/CDC6 n=1 Tax=Hexamita inflata TaxID=28002 RepID=A0AA86NX38_9EUKA|nr:Orc1/CDC6 [Hexamita inflata]
MNKPISVEQLVKAHELLSLNYHPANLGPRTEQHDQINQLLVNNPEHVLIFLSGNPACGKTTVIKKIIQKYDTIFVNAALISAPEQIFVLLYRHLAKSSKPISHMRAYSSLLTLIEKKSSSILPLIIIDEVDYLTKKSMEPLYKLLELNLRFIFAANSLNFLAELGQQRISSRMSRMHDVQFLDYTAEQFKDILQIRLQQLKCKDLFDPMALNLLAKRCQLNGDLRRFLIKAFNAIDAARRRNSYQVQAQDVHKVTTESKSGQYTETQLIILQGAFKNIRKQELFDYLRQQIEQLNVKKSEFNEAISELFEQNALAETEEGLVVNVPERQFKDK